MEKGSEFWSPGQPPTGDATPGKRVWVCASHGEGGTFASVHATEASAREAAAVELGWDGGGPSVWDAKMRPDPALVKEAVEAFLAEADETEAGWVDWDAGVHVAVAETTVLP